MHETDVSYRSIALLPIYLFLPVLYHEDHFCCSALRLKAKVYTNHELQIEENVFLLLLLQINYMFVVRQTVRK